MSVLPTYLRRLPFVFYALAVLLGGWRFYNEWTTSMLTFQYAQEFNPMGPLAKSSGLYWAASEAAYMIANGAIIHVLIAVYDKVATRD